MKAILIRVGADQSFGGYNAPVCTQTNEFVYVPIPEGPKSQCHDHLARYYDEFVPALASFAQECQTLSKRWVLPQNLLGRLVHLDPDFEHLTYGDNGAVRGSRLKEMTADDLLVFYAGLRPLDPRQKQLTYALIGMLTVQEIVPIANVPSNRWIENAHTRKRTRGDSDIIVRGQAGSSGRFRHCIAIGEYRNRAYRVRRDLLEAWGDLDVRDGFIQRSVRPPMFCKPDLFAKWLDEQPIELIAANNP